MALVELRAGAGVGRGVFGWPGARVTVSVLVGGSASAAVGSAGSWMHILRRGEKPQVPSSTAVGTVGSGGEAPNGVVSASWISGRIGVIVAPGPVPFLP